MDPNKRNYSHFPAEMEGEEETLRIYPPQPHIPTREELLDNEPDDEIRWSRDEDESEYKQ